jgi:Tol biopolymer transport system component
MKKDGSEKTDISVHGGGEWRLPNWSPDGNRIVFIKYGNPKEEVYTMDINGNNLQRLTYLNQVYGWDYDIRRVKCSYDGSKIAYGVQTSNGVWITVINSNGTNQVKIYNGSELFCWTPDGKIIFMAEGTKPFPGRGDLWIVNPDGTGLRRLTYPTGK